MTPDVTWVPLLLVVLLYAGIAPALGAGSPRARLLVTGAAIACILRYAWWRWTATILPVAPEATWQYAWTVGYGALESLLMLDAVVFLSLMSRTVDRRGEADGHERWARACAADRRRVSELPTVDVFIPTFNEGWDVLEKTIVAALVLDWPRLRVHVLDDGRRDWLRAECARLGAGYLARPDNRHAKAGNINHALARTDGELVLVLDADFVPQRDFLMRTVGFFRDPGVGVVQVPHHFFNPDPLQANLGLHQRYSDDQEFFFRDVMPARDAWGVAFSCGSNGVVRRSALGGGGIPTSSVTEDILTSLVLLQRGWRTVYLNERLARGLAPEGLSALYTQRARWARGAIQLLFLPEGPLRAGGLRLRDRVFFSPLAWVSATVALPIVTLAPVLFFWCGLVAIPEAHPGELLQYQVPMLVAALWASRRVATVHRNPLIACAYQLFQAYRLLPAVLHALVRPFGVGFQVTPKGALARQSREDRRAVGISLALIALTVVGSVVNTLPAWERVPVDAFLLPSLLWGAVLVVVMMICLLMAFEFPRTRQGERFVIDEVHALRLPGLVPGALPARVQDLALGGAALRLALGDLPGAVLPPVGTPVELVLSDVGVLTGQVVRHVGDTIAGVQFDEPDAAVRRYLVAKIFAHGYENHGKHVAQAAAGWALLRRLMGLRAAGTVRAADRAAAPPPAPALRPRLDLPPHLAYPTLPAGDERAAPALVA